MATGRKAKAEVISLDDLKQKTLDEIKVKELESEAAAKAVHQSILPQYQRML